MVFAYLGGSCDPGSSRLFRLFSLPSLIDALMEKPRPLVSFDVPLYETLLFIRDRGTGGSGQRDNLKTTKSCFGAPLPKILARIVKGIAKFDQHVQ